MLEKKIEALGSYFDGMFRLPEGYNGVRICMPENWVVYEEKTNEFTITPKVVIDNNIRKMMFIGSPEAKIIDIMNFAYKVIIGNLENEKKKQLFQIRVKELGNIFDNNELSKLETLIFSFEKTKKSKKETKSTITTDEEESPQIKKTPELTNVDTTQTKKENKPIINVDEGELGEIKKLSQSK